MDISCAYGQWNQAAIINLVRWFLLSCFDCADENFIDCCERLRKQHACRHLPSERIQLHICRLLVSFRVCGIFPLLSHCHCSSTCHVCQPYIDILNIWKQYICTRCLHLGNWTTFQLSQPQAESQPHSLILYAGTRRNIFLKMAPKCYDQMSKVQFLSVCSDKKIEEWSTF